MENLKRFEVLIEIVVICLSTTIIAGLMVFNHIKNQQLHICDTIQTEQIRADCVRSAR